MPYLIKKVSDFNTPDEKIELYGENGMVYDCSEKNGLSLQHFTSSFGFNDKKDAEKDLKKEKRHNSANAKYEVIETGNTDDWQ